MARQDLKELGFRVKAAQGSSTSTASSAMDPCRLKEEPEQALQKGEQSKQHSKDANERKREGFIAGVRR